MPDRPPLHRRQTDPVVVPGRVVLNHPDAPKVDRNAETLVACPWCDARGMVTPVQRAEWIAAYAELTQPKV